MRGAPAVRFETPGRGALHPELARARPGSVAGRLGFAEVQDVRVGRYLEVRVAAASREDAARRIDEMCRGLIANTVIEDYRFELEG